MLKTFATRIKTLKSAIFTEIQDFVGNLFTNTQNYSNQLRQFSSEITD